jgi:hypothetical protein
VKVKQLLLAKCTAAWGLRQAFWLTYVLLLFLRLLLWLLLRLLLLLLLLLFWMPLLTSLRACRRAWLLCSCCCCRLSCCCQDVRLHEVRPVTCTASDRTHVGQVGVGCCIPAQVL